MNHRADEILDLYFPVLDHGFIALVDYMGGDEAIERAARCSYASVPENRGESAREKLINYLVGHGHTSPLEMVELIFHVGMPIFVARQWIRHRTASLNEYSGRYSEMPAIFYRPSLADIKNQSTTNKQGGDDGSQNWAATLFRGALEEDCDNATETYDSAIRNGIARETARVGLPLCTYTYMYWKIDLHNLFNFLRLRIDPHAQFEIRRYAEIMAGMVQRVAPIAFDAWENHQLGAARFSRVERSALEYLRRGSPITAACGFVGLAGREVDEFRAKLEYCPPRSFDLDLSKAKPGTYYAEKIKAATQRGE